MDQIHMLLQPRNEIYPRMSATVKQYVWIKNK